MDKYSQIFSKTTREDPKDESAINAKLLIRAGFIDKLMAGVYTVLPLGLLVMKKIENIIREEINAIDGQEIFMPTLQPKENWETTGRWSTMDDLYKVKDLSGREMALGPTHEEVIVPLMKRFLNSYKDLPVYVYQFQNKFRMELRSKSGILRGREFMMKDLYSFHLDEKDLDDYYEKAKDAYFKIFQRVGIKDQTHLTLASGGSFSKYSHEFQTITDAGEDIIYVCSQCQMAINKDIKDENKECPECKNTDFKEEKSIEVGNIFKLKNKYSAPFDLSVANEKGEQKEVVMGCYGIGLGRLMGTIVEVYHDEKGIVWPKSIAPYDVIITDLIGDPNHPELKKLIQELERNDQDVLLDDRDISAGQKLADADLIGIPLRVVISKRSLESGGVAVKKRNESEESIISLDNIGSYCKKA